MSRTARRFVLAGLLACSPALASAQATWQPTPAPTVSAENEAWYQAGEPIMFSDTYYYRAGAPVFFNRYQMVRTGSYRGIPIYADTTQDPYGIIYVPIANGLLQPYERRRTGQLAGTTGHRAPSFPTSIAAEGEIERPASISTAAPPETFPEVEPVSTTGRSIIEAPRASVASVIRPKGINDVWISYEGKRWFAAGKAVRLTSQFKQMGSYHGFPVYQAADDPERIYIPTAENMVAPYSTNRRPTQKPRRQ